MYLKRESFEGSKTPRGLIIKPDDLEIWNSKIRFFSLVGSKKYEWFTSNNTHDKGAVENEWKYLIPFWN